jgi:hypothetical protein
MTKTATDWEQEFEVEFVKMGVDGSLSGRRSLLTSILERAMDDARSRDMPDGRSIGQVADELAGRLRKDFGFDMRSGAGLRWLINVVREIKCLPVTRS